MHFERKFLLFCFRAVTYFFCVFSVGWWDIAKLEASETHRTVNVNHEQMGTDLLTLSVFFASSSYLKLEQYTEKKYHILLPSLNLRPVC